MNSEYEFILPRGYVDGNGTVHRRGVMRLATVRRPDGTTTAVLESVHNTPGDVIAGALSGILDIDMTALLAAYHGPRLAIAASEIENPASLHVQFPDIPVKKMSGTGHWLMMDKPDEFNALLDEFLATLDRAH